MFECVVETVSVENGKVLVIGSVSSGEIRLGAKDTRHCIVAFRAQV
jgi:hypothetical protein